MDDGSASGIIERVLATVLFAAVLYIGRDLSDDSWLAFAGTACAGGWMGSLHRRWAGHAGEVLAFLVLVAGLSWTLAFAGVDWGGRWLRVAFFAFTTLWLAFRIGRRWRRPAPPRPVPLEAFDAGADWEPPEPQGTLTR